jgi:hypothetical protein
MPMIATTAKMSILGFGGLGHQFTGNPGINSAWLAKIGTFGTAVGNKNIASRIAVDKTTGNFYIGGQENVGTTGIFGFAMTKVSSTGSILWQKIIGAFNTEAHVLDCCVDSSGNVYWIGTAQFTSGQPAGYTTSSSRDGYFGKFNSDGTTGFIKRINLSYSTASYTDSGEGIAYSASDNTIVITGRTPSMPTTTTTSIDKCLIAKFSTSGTQVWLYTYYAPSSSVAFYGKGVSVDSSGNIYISAYSIIANSGNTLIALNSSGALRWANRVYVGGNAAVAVLPYRTITTNGNNVVLAQSGATTVTPSKNIVLVTLYNSSGTVIWQSTVDTTRGTSTIPGFANTSPGTPSSSANNLMGIAKDSSDNIYVAVDGRSNTTADCILLYKFDAASGSVLWVRAIYINTGSVATVPTGLDCLGNFLYLVGTTDQETTTTTTGQGNYIFAKLPIDGSAISSTGYTVDTGISYLNVDVGSFHTPVALTHLNQSMTSDVSNSVGTTAFHTATEVALTVSNNSMQLQSKTISIA